MSNGRYEPKGEPLTPAEIEVLNNLQEEAAEVIKAASKLLRFGKEDIDPKTGGSNTYYLGLEIGNLVTMINLVGHRKLVLEADVEQGKADKLSNLSRFSRYLP